MDLLHMLSREIRVVRIKDGDTYVVDIYLGFGVWLTNQTVRLLSISPRSGINCPERHSDKGKLAKEEVSKILDNNPEVEYRIEYPVEKRDGFGRILADVSLFDKKTGAFLDSISDYLIEKDLAKYKNYD